MSQSIEQRDKLADWIGARIDMLTAERKRLCARTQDFDIEGGMKFVLSLYAAIEALDAAIRRLEDAREALA